MKTAMLTYSTRPRGGVVHALKLSEKLSQKGVNITLFSLARSDDESALKGYYRDVRIPFQIIPYDWHRDVIQRLENMIDAYVGGVPDGLDLYHAQDCVGGTALARAKQKGAISAPIFRTIHHVDDFAEARLFDFEKRAVALAERRFVVSKHWKEALNRDFGVDSVVAYNGIDLKDYLELPSRKSRNPTVLFVGGLESRKGLEYLILAMASVVKEVPSAQLVAVAKSGFRGVDERAWFEVLTERAGIGGSVALTESVSEHDLLQMYADCDLLACPSRNEGWGLALMEAMACRKPVVASRVGGVPELVDESCGILVEPGDIAELSRGIIRLLSDEGLRTKLAENGHERVKGYTWDRAADVVLREYRKAVHDD